MSFLWKLLRIFRICMCLRSRKSPLHSDFQPTSTYSYKDIKRKKQEKTFWDGCRFWVVGSGLGYLFFLRNPPLAKHY